MSASNSINNASSSASSAAGFSTALTVAPQASYPWKYGTLEALERKVDPDRHPTRKVNENTKEGWLQLPIELQMNLMNRLKESDFATAATVCKSWSGATKQITSDRLEAWETMDLKKRFPKLQIIDKAVWVSVFGQEKLTELGLVFSEQSVNKSAVGPYLAKLDFSRIENDAGMTLLEMPQGLSLELFQQLLVANNEGGPTEKISNDMPTIISNRYGKAKIERAYCIAMSNGLVEGSRSQLYTTQEVMVAKMGGRAPKVLEAVACDLLTLRSSSTTSPTRIYKFDPTSAERYFTSTRCLEKVDRDCPLVIGRFFHFNDLDIRYDETYHTNCGVAGMTLSWEVPPKAEETPIDEDQ